MKKIYSLSFAFLFTASAFGQSTPWSAPDSARNIVKPGAGPSPAWTVSNPLVHSGTSFSNSPISSGFINNVSDYLYFNDFGLAVPTTATITGIELIISRGACNTGDYFRDTISLAYDGAAIGNYIQDSTGSAGAIDTIGGSSNLWGNALTPAMVNSYKFGVCYSVRSFGICTFAVFDCRVKVHYSLTTGLEGVAISKATKVYPNPAASSLVIESAGGNYTISDQLGRVVLNGVAANKSTMVDISALNPGLYFIRSGNEVVKFVKQ
jgi:hypothetical protein